MSILKTITGLLMVAVLTACGGGGGEGSGTTTSTTTTTTTSTSAAATASVASILLTAPSPQTINADGTSTLVLTVKALDSSSGLVKGAAIGLVASGNTVLSVSTVTTDAITGLATVALTANAADASTRVATVTASCTSCAASAASLSVQVNGATLTLTSSGGSSITVGSSLDMNAVVSDPTGKPLAGQVVTFAVTDSNVLSLKAVSATSNSSGIAVVNVSGLVAGSANVTATALGNAKSIALTVAAGNTISITSPPNKSAMVVNVPQAISVSAPGASSVTFLSTVAGTFSSTVVTGSTFTSNLTVAQAGSTTVSVVDNLGHIASVALYVSPPVSAANRVILSASQSTLPLVTGTTTPSVRLTARALYTFGGSDQGVANVPILFTNIGGPADGEYLTPAYQLTDSSGYAYADFYSGKSASIQNGIAVGAQIQGTAIQTGTSPSSNPVLLTVGGQALSVAFGQSSVIRESSDKTMYILDYSVQVTDASNNPVSNSVVTLRVMPVAFSTGSACTPIATYCSEDANHNGSLEAVEDGVRVAYPTSGQCPDANSLPAASLSAVDGKLTPVNSTGGAVVSTVTTDSGGIAGFSLTYLKASAIWITNKLSATASVVSGTESTNSTTFRLPYAISDYDGTTPASCLLPPSPFLN